MSNGKDTVNLKRLMLGDAKHTRLTIAKICRSIYRHDPDDCLDPSDYRLLLEALKLHLAALRQEGEGRVETRLEAVEEALREEGKM